MDICRFHKPGTGPCIGVVVNGQVHNASDAGLCDSIFTLLTSERPWELATRVAEQIPASRSLAELDRTPDPEQPHLLAPLDAQEVWACGVTYLRSRDARVHESADADIYTRVYSAQRPEIFLKSTPHRTVGPNQPITIRSDSTWNVPEPELAVVLSPDLQLVGYTIGNDVSSRSIEGENPLYLPQAKIWNGACALGPVITLADPNGPAAPVFEIRLMIERGGAIIFEGVIPTDQMRRSIAELVDYLGRANSFPDGVMLLTGTGIVPPDDITLQPGDQVEITIPGIGTLRNPVALA